MNGCTSRRASGACPAYLAKKFFAVFLSFVLVLTLTPAAAWAQAVESVTGGDVAAADSQPSVVDGEDATATDAVGIGEEAASGDDGAGVEGPTEKASSAKSSEDDLGSSSVVSGTRSVSGGESESAEPNSEPATSSIDDVIAKLDEANWRPAPEYGVDTNMNDLLKKELSSMGVDDVDVTVSKVEYVNKQEKSDLGVSAAADATNGDIEFFFMNPDDVTGWFANYAQWCQVRVTYSLSRDGVTEEYSPSRAVSIPWNEEKVASMLEEVAASLKIGFAAGEGADAVTSDIVLPYKVADASGFSKSWTTVAWKSNSDAVKVSGSSWEDYRGTVSRSSSDQPVELTATIGVVSAGGPSATVEKVFSITVLGDPAQIESDRKELEEKVDSAFAPDALTYSESGGAVDVDRVSGDIQLPTPSKLGIDGGAYSVTYSSSTDAVEVNGYRANVFQPLPGDDAAAVEVTCTVTNKSNPQVSASKSISLLVLPLEGSDIEAELSLMEKAKAGYAFALADGGDPSAIAGNLHAFQKAFLDEDGNLAWAYDADSANAAGFGIVAVDLPGYDSMGSAQWRLFKSSDPSVISHENLLVTQPEYNTSVTVESSLSSEKFARYAERYADDATWGSAFARLANQAVSASFTVIGTSGEEDPNAEASVTIIGVDGHGDDQAWLTSTSYAFEKGATAADLTERAFEENGIEADFEMESWGWSLSTITSPFDEHQTLGWDEATGKYWQLFVNGVASDKGAGSVVLEPGDSVVWYYSAYGSAAPTNRISVSVSVIGVNASGEDEIWAGQASYVVEEGATVASISERAFEENGIGADFGDSTYGWYLNTITSPFDGRVLGWDEATGKYWQLFVNGVASDKGAGSVVLEPGDSVVWYYSAYKANLPGQSKVSVSVVGRDSNGNVQDWGSVSVSVLEGAGAEEAVRAALDRLGLAYQTESAPDWDAFTRILSVASPFDKDFNLVAGSVDPDSWEISDDAWYLAYNGDGRDVWLQYIDALSPGDEIMLYYGEFNRIPDANGGDIVVDPDAPRPDDYESSWPSFAGTSSGAVTDALTPTQAAKLDWVFEYGDEQGASDPLIVNGDVYLVSGSTLMRIDGESGELIASASIGSSIRYFCRPAYADGLVIVPSDDGRLTAFTADVLVPVWRTDALDTTGLYQALSSLTVSNGCVYAAFTVPGGAYESGSEGTIVCVSIESGELLWKSTAKSSETGASEGYYWAGAAVSGNDIVIGNEAGKVALIDGATGRELSSVNIGTPCRAGIVISDLDKDTMLAVSRDDGTLYKIVREGDLLKIVGKVVFAKESTSTPAVVNGKAYVCGMDADGYGTLSVIDVGSMSVENTVRGGKGASQSSPLVSVQSDGTFVYFTCNARPGCVYGYRVGDRAAYVLYTPSDEYQQYCTASIVCDAEGNLYYTNDAGVLFKLAAREGALVTFDSCGGSDVASAYVAVGASVARPSDPWKEGYTFIGWYTDKAYGTAWDFGSLVEGSMTLYAKWNESRVDSPVVVPGDNVPNDHGGVGNENKNDAPSSIGPSGAVAPGASPVSDEGEKKGDSSGDDSSASAAAGARSTVFSPASSLTDDVQAVANDDAENAEQGQRSMPLAAFIGLGVGVICLIGALGWLMASRRRGE